MTKDQKAKMEAKYAAGGWDGLGSGPGSTIIFTMGYVEMLRRFIVANRIRSVLDLACGDFQFMCRLEMSAAYTGIDIVPSVIHENCVKYSAFNRKFTCADITEGGWPRADLVLIKDVVHHIVNDDTDYLIDLSKACPLVMWTIEVDNNYRALACSDAAADYFGGLEIVYEFDRAVEPYKYGKKITLLARNTPPVRPADIFA